MSVIRVNKTKDYTIMSNYHLNDINLSLKAKGLLSVMLSLPEDWDYSIRGLAAISKEGEKAIRTVLTELEDAGYLTRTRVQDNKGRFSDVVYDIFEKPNQNLAENEENQGFEPCAQKRHVDERHVDEAHVEKDRQLNTKELNTKELNTKSMKERKSCYNEILDKMVTEPKLKEALIEFIKMRKLSKKPPTDHALELLIEKLYKLSSDPQTQIEIVEQSILNNWQGFFPLKTADNVKKGYSEKGTSRDKQYSDFEKYILNSGAGTPN